MEFGSEGAELEEVSEQPLEEVLGEVLGWKGCMVVLGITGLGIEKTQKHFWNWKAVGVQRMPKMSEVGVGKTPR